MVPVAASALLLGVVAACSHDAPATPSDAGKDSAEAGAPDGGDSAVACTPATRPASVPVGWETEKTYWPCCGIYVPTTKEQMPEPIVWEPCDAPEVPPTWKCRQMKVDWTPPKEATTAVAAAIMMGWLNPNGGVTFAFDRWKEEGIYRLFADADGPVRAAVLANQWKYCNPYTESVGSGYYAYKVMEGSVMGGAIVGKLDELQPLYTVRSEEMVHSGFSVGSYGVMHIGNGQQISVRPWTDLDTSIFVASPATQKGRQQNMAHFFGDALFWNSFTGSSPSELMVWTPDGGTQALVSTEPDWTKGVLAMSTDGKDMVWSYGENRTKPSDPFGTNYIMTAPYTTDPKAIQPRKVRSTGAYGIGSQYAVGCGYAARGMAFDQSKGMLEIVRLSDGVAWYLDGKTWHVPIAVTCDEVFISATFTPKYWYQVARVRLDSLGPGVLP